ncbi:MAG: DoxX family protein [Hyphomicrobiales bacterium]|nr:DoxX family protein [Hyphomicrobiales bacterium]
MPRGLTGFMQSVTGLLRWLVPMSLIKLLMRIWIARVFYLSGLTKIDSDYTVTDITVLLFAEEYQVPIIPPEIAAYMATGFELGCAALIAFGLLTRLATLPLIGMTIIIQLFVYPNLWPDHMLWFAILLLLLSRGPGKLSLDYLLGGTVFKS